MRSRSSKEASCHAQLYALGITRYEVRSQVRSGRWQLIGDQAVALHNGAVSDHGPRWAAVFSGGPRAQLDGAASLVASGLQRYDVERIRVSVPRGARVRGSRRYDIRQARRWSRDDAVGSGIPRTRPAVAAAPTAPPASRPSARWGRASAWGPGEWSGRSRA